MGITTIFENATRKHGTPFHVTPSLILGAGEDPLDGRYAAVGLQWGNWWLVFVFFFNKNKDEQT